MNDEKIYCSCGEMMAIICEAQRHDVTPKAFWKYVNKRLSKVEGYDSNDDLHLETWIESLDVIIDPPEYMRYNSHSSESVCVIRPGEFHMYQRDDYNIIMEFEFDTEKIGHGYFFMALADYRL